MPYTVRRLPHKNLYKVYNTNTKEVHSYGTTLDNAKKQVRLLYMLDNKKMKGKGASASVPQQQDNFQPVIPNNSLGSIIGERLERDALRYDMEEEEQNEQIEKEVEEEMEQYEANKELKKELKKTVESLRDNLSSINGKLYILERENFNGKNDNYIYELIIEKANIETEIDEIETEINDIAMKILIFENE